MLNFGKAQDSRMTGEEVSKTLPDELVEKIIAMMPFPSIFKARCLSKSWLARFQPISSLQEEESKRIATSFQNQVAKWSNKWETFQIYTFIVTDFEEDYVGFDRTLQNLKRRPSLRFLREVFYLENQLYFGGDMCSYTKSNLQIEGPLLFGTVDINKNEEELYVANLLTQKWKRLPPRPHIFKNLVYCSKLVVETTSPTYKLILFCYDFSVQLYDSKSGTWGGELQFLVGFQEFPYLEEGTLTRLTLSGKIRVLGRQLVVCNDTLFLIAIELDHVCVFKVGLATSTIWEVARCPNSGFKPIPLNGTVKMGDNR